MIRAFFNDIAQRIITADKLEQRRYLSNIVKTLNINSGFRVLDFGCGTGLFSRVFTKTGIVYTGYDIDRELIVYGRRINKGCFFTSSMEELRKLELFDMVLVNCCFHHINDNNLLEELAHIRSLLLDNGILIIIDIVRAEKEMNPFCSIFKFLEKGEHVRSVDEYRKYAGKYFKLKQQSFIRSHLFSIKNFFIYNNLVMLVCEK